MGARGNGFPLCYACGEKHEGGYRRCPNVSDEVRIKTIAAVKAAHFAKKDNDSSTIITKGTASTGKRSGPKKGAAFAEVEEEDDEDEEEEDLPLPTYQEYLRENGVIQLNVGKTDRVFEGDCVSEFGIGCVQVSDVVKPARIKGTLFADAGEWKVQGRGESRPIKSSRVVETVSEDIASVPEDGAGSAVGKSAAPNEKPAWMNNLRVKGLAKKAQAAIEKEMGVLKKAGVFKPLEKAIKLTSSKKAVIKKARPTVNEKGPILASGPGGRFTLTWWKCYLDSCASYHSFFIEEFLRDIKKGKSTMEGSCNAGTVSTNTKGWYGDFEVWLNKKGIANLMSIPMLSRLKTIFFPLGEVTTQ